jgi:hypothetical protein
MHKTMADIADRIVAKRIDVSGTRREPLVATFLHFATK